MDTPVVKVGETVLVSESPSGRQWFPAIVTQGNTEGESNIVCHIFHKHGVRISDGCKHKNDPWWNEPERISIAAQEGIGVWKVTEQYARLEKMSRILDDLSGHEEGDEESSTDEAEQSSDKPKRGRGRPSTNKTAKKSTQPSEEAAV
tara:strand:+ start:12461 stop:12901 length:441 start_codon:yes stop_codon:yes gene_type:complete